MHPALRNRAAIALTLFQLVFQAQGAALEEIPQATIDEEVLEVLKEPAVEPLLLEEPAREGSSVTMQESFVFDAQQNIDGFLGEYDRGFASSDDAYEGSRSESRGNRGLPF